MKEFNRTMMPADIHSLLRKFDVPVPRYTSYPTVPFWKPETLTTGVWKEKVKNTFLQENGEICIYIHLPYCENLCTFCACNKRITKNHSVEHPYIQAVLKEWDAYQQLFPSQPVIREIHLGGGTPTFFSPEHLKELIVGITKDAVIPHDHSFSVEVHPNYTTYAHLDTLAKCGFNRISLGVQDFDPVVQDIINRHQSYETTKEVTDAARTRGYLSINIDLIYGLPRQTIHSITETVSKIKLLQPDRIAYYSYAHVPWKSKVQRRYTDEDVPKADEKWNMYTHGKELLTEAGYISIGMDHFATAGDALFTAKASGKLHRNFMGYTTTNNKLLIGLGASAISDCWNAFAQNEKDIDSYLDAVTNKEFPIQTGHLLSDEELYLRRKILDLMCLGETTISSEQMDPDHFQSAMKQLHTLQDDALVQLKGNTIKVTETGELFIRNIVSTLDAGLFRNGRKDGIFSRAI